MTNEIRTNEIRTNEILDEKLRKAIEALPREIAPQHDLWPGIAEQIAPRRRWPQPWPIAAAVAGLVAIGVIASTFALHRRAMAPVVASQSPAQPQALVTASALSARGQFIAATIRKSSGMDPKTQAVLLKNLDIIETSIANIQQALDQDPGNAALQPLLYQLYRDEAALVTAAQRVQLQHTTGVIAL